MVLSQGCTPTDPWTCGSARGDIFYINESSTWQDEGFYELDLELNLGYMGNGDFGYDTVSLGLLGTGLPNMSSSDFGWNCCERLLSRQLGHFSVSD